jgi:hypothetical protein
MRHEGTKIWRDMILEKRFKNVEEKVLGGQYDALIRSSDRK